MVHAAHRSARTTLSRSGEHLSNVQKLTREILLQSVWLLTSSSFFDSSLAHIVFCIISFCLRGLTYLVATCAVPTDRPDCRQQAPRWVSRLRTATVPAEIEAQRLRACSALFAANSAPRATKSLQSL